MPDPATPTWQHLLAERERRSLRAAFFMRAALAAGGAVLVWFTGGAVVERVASTALWVAVLGGCVLALRALGDARRIALAATVGAALDSVVLVALVGMWHLVYTSPQTPLIHLLGHNLTVTTLLLMMVNCAALRPAYPAAVGAVGAVLHLVLAVLAVTDPRLASYPGGLARAIEHGRGVGDLYLVPMLILAAGVLLAALTHALRQTVQEVVEREEREHQLREDQIRVVLEARMSALAQIVSGVEHEVNSPLGAVRSSADTASRALERLREALDIDDPDERQRKLERALKSLEAAVDLTARAGARLGEVIDAIDGFVQPDRAERRAVDLAECLSGCVDMLQPRIDARVRVETQIESGLVVQGDPGRLAQSFTTVIKNAVEAIDETGIVRIAAELDPNHAVIEVSDSGRGMTAEQIAQLFEVDFARGSRVRARFGLPACQSVIHSHGGEIVVTSEPGAGTTVRIQLPR